MRRFALAAVMLGTVSVTARAQETVGKAAIRAQSRAVTARALRDQLWSVFATPDERRSGDRPRHSLSRVWVVGKPYATRYPGLCRADSLVVRFAPVDQGGRENAATPVQAYGVEASAGYFVTSVPAMRKPADDDRSPFDGACDRQPAGSGPFTALGDDDAHDGFRAAIEAIAAVAAGRLRVAPCGRYPSDTGSCEQVVAALPPAELAFAKACEAAANQRCFTVVIADRELTVRLAQADEFPRPASLPADGTVVSVGMDSLIMVADGIAD